MLGPLDTGGRTLGLCWKDSQVLQACVRQKSEKQELESCVHETATCFMQVIMRGPCAAGMCSPAALETIRSDDVVSNRRRASITGSFASSFHARLSSMQSSRPGSDSNALKPILPKASRGDREGQGFLSGPLARQYDVCVAVFGEGDAFGVPSIQVRGGLVLVSLLALGWYCQRASVQVRGGLGVFSCPRLVV